MRTITTRFLSAHDAKEHAHQTMKYWGQNYLPRSVATDATRVLGQVEHGWAITCTYKDGEQTRSVFTGPEGVAQ